MAAKYVTMSVSPDNTVAAGLFTGDSTGALRCLVDEHGDIVCPIGAHEWYVDNAPTNEFGVFGIHGRVGAAEFIVYLKRERGAGWEYVGFDADSRYTYEKLKRWDVRHEFETSNSQHDSRTYETMADFDDEYQNGTPILGAQFNQHGVPAEQVIPDSNVEDWLERRRQRNTWGSSLGRPTQQPTPDVSDDKTGHEQYGSWDPYQTTLDELGGINE